MRQETDHVYYLESFTELARTKVATHQTNLLRERAVVQCDLARAEACVRSARCFMEGVIDDVWKVVAAGREVAVEQRATLRLAAVDGVQRAVEAVDLVFNAAGATSIHTSSPIERCFRDIHVVPAHFVVQPPMYEAVGRVMLGMPSGMALVQRACSSRVCRGLKHRADDREKLCAGASL